MPRVFTPARRFGLVFHLGVISALLVLSVWGLWRAAYASIGPVFLLYLVPTLAAVVLVPLLGYRAYALYTAGYTLERDGLRLRWGLRVEDIPMDQLTWVGQAAEFPEPVRLPWPRWPGSVVGQRHLADGRPVEFLAGSSRELLLIASRERVFAISPYKTAAFLQAFHRLVELGSLSPLPARSVYPSFLVSRVWRTATARWLLLSGLAINLISLVWVSLVAPGGESVVLGFGVDRELVPAVRLLLLPVLSILLYLADFFVGLFLFRRGYPVDSSSLRSSSADPLLALPTEAAPMAALPIGARLIETGAGALRSLAVSFSGLPISGLLLAYLVWGGGVLSSVLFLLAVYFILSA